MPRGFKRVVKCGKCNRKIPESMLYDQPFGIIWSRNRGFSHRICPKRERKPKQGRIAKPKAQHYGTNVDLQAMGEFRFQNGEPLTDEDSRIYKDGRQKFEEADYTARVREVLARAQGKCEWKVRGHQDRYFWNDADEQMCGQVANEHPHHLIPRRDGRDDRASNLIAICDRCHLLAHPEKRTRFSGSKR